MNRLLYGLLLVAACVAPAFGCKITVINDTAVSVLALDADYVEADLLKPNEQALYGEEHRHPNVMLYLLEKTNPDGGNPRWKKSYNIEQKACAMNDADKIVRISSIVSNDGTINSDIFNIINFADGVVLLPCCHHSPGMEHEPAIDEPVSRNDADAE